MVAEEVDFAADFDDFVGDNVGSGVDFVGSVGSVGFADFVDFADFADSAAFGDFADFADFGDSGDFGDSADFETVASLNLLVDVLVELHCVPEEFD